MIAPTAMKSLLLLLLTAYSALAYEGAYTLINHRDANGDSVDLPTGKFTLTITQQEDEEDKFAFSFKVGNLMSAIATILPDNSATFGVVISTRMMPPPEIYQLEQDLAVILEAANTVDLDDDVLVIAGDEGSLSFKSKAEGIGQGAGVNKKKKRRQRLRRKRIRNRNRVTPSDGGNEEEGTRSR